VLAAGDHFVEAKAVIFCTGYETVRGLPKAGTNITSSWAAATAPGVRLPAWLSHTLVWEASDPYLYIRTDAAGRLIVGGEDSDLDSAAYRAETLLRKSRILARKMHALLPDVSPRWTHAWAGAFGERADGLPIIDAVPGLAHGFAVLGFGGNGTIYSMLAAHLMPSLLRGRPLKDAKLFQFR
jgi:glycine/D-amino acid oxidase-like deaminating enzyme